MHISILRFCTLVVLCGLTLHASGSAGKYTIEFTESFSAGQNTIYIPFRLVGRLIAVQAQVDTNSGIFIIDTGSSDLLLNDRYFDSDYKLTASRGVGVTGDAGSVRVTDVDTLFWDNLQIYDVKGHVVPLTSIEETKRIRLIGVLGFEVFKDYELLIDYSIRQMVVTRVDKKGKRYDQRAIYQRPVDSLSFKLIGHTMVLRGEINGVKLKFGLDTGAELNLLNVNVRRKALDNFEILRRVNMRGAGSREVEVLAGIMYEVDVGIDQVPGMRTLLTQMIDVNKAFGTYIDGVLGYEFLFDKRTLINYRKKTLYFFDPIKS